MSKAATPAGRRRLFMEDDRVKVSLPKLEARFGKVSQYDTQTRKMQVKYEGEEEIDLNWINIKYVERVTEDGSPIPRPSRASRSSSRGRESSKTRVTKKTVASRTRSKSRERAPVTAAFSADEDATEPVVVQAKVKSPKKKASTPTRSSARKAEKESLKDAEFSADEEEEVNAAGAALEKAAEANSKEDSASVAEPDSKSGASCDAAVQFFDNLAQCSVMAVKMMISNVPMILCLLIAVYSHLFIVDKKNIRASSFYNPLSKSLPKFPEIPVERFSWTWLSTDLAIWKSQILNLWTILKFPVIISAKLYLINYLKEQFFDGYKIVIGAKPRCSTKVNLRKVWLFLTGVSAFIIYAEDLMPYFEKLVPIENPITPVLKNLFLMAHGHAYDIITMVFRSSTKFYFNVLVLAFFKSYHDFDFDFKTTWQRWFMNTEHSTALNTRFVIGFGSEMFLQTCFFVLAAKNPTNMFLWVIFNARLIQNYLSVRGEEEETAVRRFHMSGNVSGWWFYLTSFFKCACFTNIWRFISKTERVTTCKYGIAAFGVLQLTSFVVTYMANKEWPSNKKSGIHAHIRQAARLGDILCLASMTALCDFKFGNAPLWVLGLYVIHTLVDAVLQEEAQVAHSRTKWESYYKNVAYKFIPKVY